MTREDCNDVVSREAVINLILEDAVRTGTGHRYTSIQNMNNEINEVRFLPPVTPNILDKIKAEIEQIEINGYIRDVECFRAGINVALNVIDKYKAGSEV